MRVVLIFGIVILVSACLYAGTRLTSRLPRRWLWSALVIGLGAFALLLWAHVAVWPISDLAVILVAVLAASVIGMTLTSSPALIAFCLSAGIVDFLSFSGGLTARIIADYNQGRGLLLQYLSITAPLPGRITPIIGIGDLIILGSVYCSLRQIGYRDWLGFLFPLGGLIIALGIGLLTSGIYALPFIGGATIAYLLLKARSRSPRPPDVTGQS